jgi:hypothetical protein
MLWGALLLVMLFYGPVGLPSITFCCAATDADAPPKSGLRRSGGLGPGPGRDDRQQVRVLDLDEETSPPSRITR